VLARPGELLDAARPVTPEPPVPAMEQQPEESRTALPGSDDDAALCSHKNVTLMASLLNRSSSQSFCSSAMNCS